MSLEAAFLSLVFVAFFTAAAFSMAAARVQQAVIHAHHIAKLTASSEWASAILEPVPAGSTRGEDDHLTAVIEQVNKAMEVQAHPTLKLGCGVTETSPTNVFPRITNDEEIKGRGGNNFSWTESATGWSEFPVLRVETRCEVSLRATPGIPLPLPVKLAGWNIGIISYVPVECFVSTGTGGNLCG